MIAEEIIIRPITTEKSSNLQSRDGKYTFEVHKKATKIDVKNAVEKLFGVKVIDVKTMNVKGGLRRRGYKLVKEPTWKKSIVTIETNPEAFTYTTKGGKETKVEVSYKTSIEEFGI